VLVTGGADGTGDGGALASAEVYDPETGTFTATGTLLVPRGDHLAVLVADGRVLVAGGRPSPDGDRRAGRSAEWYDPSSGTFSPAATLPPGFALESMTLLGDGRVLLVGSMMPLAGTGPVPAPSTGIRLASTPQVAAAAFLLDPRDGTIVATGAPVVPGGNVNSMSAGHTATLLEDGQVLLAGGEGGEFEPQLYDPDTGTFAVTGSMIARRVWHTATRLPDGRVLVAGGYGGSGAMDYSELYDPATGTFGRTGPLQVARMAGHTATLLEDGGVLVTGGVEALAGPGLADAEIYR
jgi:hypothetical protein